MKITGLLVVIAVAGFYGCSDKKDTTGGEETTSLIEESGQFGDEMADQVKQGASDAGKIATESLDKATDKIGQAAINQASDNTADAQAMADKTVESASLEAAAVSDNIDPEQMAVGKTIYSKHCMACHAAGVAGAPKLSDAAVWEPRIAQGMDTLYGHAINGFKGTVGYMPPKGGFTTLNDDEVKAAVTYMVSASQ